MINTPSLQELLEAGVHFGHQVRRGNPRMKPYIYGAREGVHIIDLTIAEKKLKEACEYLYNLGKSGGILLICGTKKQAKPIVEEWGKKLNMPYVSHRWIGGTFTNLDEMNKNIKKLKELKIQQEKGELSKYTKKEQLLIARKITKMEKDFGGVLNMAVVPDSIFIIDTVMEETAIKESQRKNIKVVALADSNCDPMVIDYPIPGNDDAIKSVKILTDTALSAYEEGLKQADKDALVRKQKEEKDALKQAEVDAKVAEDILKAEEDLEKAAVKDSERVV